MAQAADGALPDAITLVPCRLVNQLVRCSMCPWPRLFGAVTTLLPQLALWLSDTRVQTVFQTNPGQAAVLCPTGSPGNGGLVRCSMRPSLPPQPVGQLQSRDAAGNAPKELEASGALVNDVLRAHECVEHELPHASLNPVAKRVCTMHGLQVLCKLVGRPHVALPCSVLCTQLSCQSLLARHYCLQTSCGDREGYLSCFATTPGSGIAADSARCALC